MKIYIWTDKLGNKLTLDEFIKRFKQGLQGVTSLQQLKMQLNSMYIIIIGLLCGITITLLSFENLWWLFIVLVGGLFNTCVQFIGVWQKKKQIEIIELNFGGYNADTKRQERIPRH